LASLSDAEVDAATVASAGVRVADAFLLTYLCHEVSADLEATILKET
jgi:hypothetical protein